MRRAASMAVAVLAAALGVVMVATASGAASGKCSVTLTVSGPAVGTNLTIAPSAAKVKVGGCVAIQNSTRPSEQVTITVTHAGKTVYTTTIPRGQTVTGSRGFSPSRIGSYTLAASSAALLGSANGQATITAKPAPSSPPTRSSSPTPTTSSSPTQTARPTKSAGTGKKKHSPKPHATGIKLPPLPPLPTNALTAPLPKGSNPVIAPGPSTAAPVTESATPVAVIYHGPIEPAADNSRGLPIAIGVLVVLGLATGWGRVLLATALPVEKRPRGDHRV